MSISFARISTYFVGKCKTAHGRKSEQFGVDFLTVRGYTRNATRELLRIGYLLMLCSDMIAGLVAGDGDHFFFIWITSSIIPIATRQNWKKSEYVI